MLPMCKTFPCEFSRFPSWHIIIIVFLLLDWLETRHKKPRAKLQNLLSFELVSDLFSSASSCQTYAIIAETWKTFRAVLSEPKVVFSSNSDVAEFSNSTENPEMQDIVTADRLQTQKRQREESRPSKKKRRRQNQEGVEAIIWCKLYLLKEFFLFLTDL